MKKFYIALLTLAAAFTVRAADTALIDEDDTWQLYTKVNYKYSEIGGDAGQFGGVEIGRLLNDHLGLALTGYMLLGDVETDDANADGLAAFDSWYGGLTTEYFFAPEKLIHGSIYLFGGGGVLKFTNANGDSQEKAAFSMVEPGVNGMININQTIEFGAGLGYRYTIGSDREGFENSDFSSYVVNVFFRFTEF